MSMNLEPNWDDFLPEHHEAKRLCRAPGMTERVPDSAAVLTLLRQRPRGLTVGEMMNRLGVSEQKVRAHISHLRRQGHNIRNKWNTHLFWLEDGPAPPLGPPGRASDRWQGEPPG